jgi:hypothetical protein
MRLATFIRSKALEEMIFANSVGSMVIRVGYPIWENALRTAAVEKLKPRLLESHSTRRMKSQYR